MTRMYHVVAINDRTGRKRRLTRTAVNHGEGCRLLHRQSPHRDVRKQLEEIIMDKYSHFVYSRSAGHLHSAWECCDDARDAAYSPGDFGQPQPGVTDYRAYTREGLRRIGVTIANDGTVAK